MPILYILHYSNQNNNSEAILFNSIIIILVDNFIKNIFCRINILFIFAK